MCERLLKRGGVALRVVLAHSDVLVQRERLHARDVQAGRDAGGESAVDAKRAGTGRHAEHGLRARGDGTRDAVCDRLGECVGVGYDDQFHMSSFLV